MFMQELIAKTSILFESKLYRVGDKLPTHNATMVEAWIKAGTAVWVEKTVSTENPVSEQKPVKAKPRTAEPGLAGQAVSSESETGEDLVGKVPKTASRSKKK